MAWWTDGVLYQIYPRSFADSDGDGVGDLRGVVEHLDHLAWLGVDGLWLNPITVSPNADWGYDVADYCAVDPSLGTMDDLDQLVSAARARDLAVVLDLVPNHTSIDHPWFAESRASRDNPKRDWYVWADAAEGDRPPNNWVSTFGGPAWTLDPTSGQWYLHGFLVEQPDLNWWNPEVRAEFERILRFWFDRGVAGFRIDVAHTLVHDRMLRDNPPATDADNWFARALGQVQRHNANQTEVHAIYRRWREIAESYEPARLLLGETFVPDVADVASFYGADDELHLAFDIPFTLAPFRAQELRAVVEETEALVPDGCSPCYTLGNHDVGRFTSRWCRDDPARIRLAAMLFFSLRGTLVLYAGDELGMPDTDVPDDRRLDPVGRDPERTPMHWTADPGAGFTAPGVEPWLPFGDLTVNVADQRDDPDAVLSLVRGLVALRRADPSLRRGRYETLACDGDVWAFRRGEHIVVALNFGGDGASLDVGRGAVVLGTDRSRDGEAVDGPLRLGAREGAIMETDDRRDA